jgi:hypothetical protein
MLARRSFVLFGAFLLGACSLPPLSLDQYTRSEIAPSGPSVAAVIANIKCELWEAANDTHELPYYLDEIGLPEHPASTHPSPDRVFNLKNLFSEIEYVAELKITLETTDSGGFNPSVNIIEPLSVATTNLTTAVGGQVYGSNDRIFNLYQSIDFARLVSVTELPMWRNGFYVGKAHFTVPKQEPRTARPPYTPVPGSEDWSHCPYGLGIHGRIGLKEDLATSAIAARMQDIAVLTPSASGSGGGISIYGQPPALSGFNGYAFGELDTTINFTINLDLNGGPNWTLVNFKGPSVSSQGGTNGQSLLNVSRYKKDSIQLTVIPVCIRPTHFPKDWTKLKVSDLKPATSPSELAGSLEGKFQNNGNIDAHVAIKPKPTNKLQLPPLNYPVSYIPEMGFGTPIWANYLPPCLSTEGQAALAAAPSAAKTNLQLQGIDNLLRTQRRF